MQLDESQLVTIGKITTVFGVKGWVKLYSHTEPVENILAYDQYYMKKPRGNWQVLKFTEGKKHGKGVIAKIAGVDDRDEAALLAQSEIAIPKSAMPELPADEYYWYQLEGLSVISDFEGESYCLGKVKHLMETGANDVLVVQPTSSSIDDRERLIPYLPGQFVTSVDLAAATINVDWDPEF